MQKTEPFTTEMAPPLVIVLLTLWLMQIWLAALAPNYDPQDASRDVTQVPN